MEYIPNPDQFIYTNHSMFVLKRDLQEDLSFLCKGDKSPLNHVNSCSNL